MGNDPGMKALQIAKLKKGRLTLTPEGMKTAQRMFEGSRISVMDDDRDILAYGTWLGVGAAMTSAKRDKKTCIWQIKDQRSNTLVFIRYFSKKGDDGFAVMRVEQNPDIKEIFKALIIVAALMDIDVSKMPELPSDSEFFS